MDQIEVSTRGRQAFHDITDEVAAVVDRCRVQEGICCVFCPHTTAGVTLNENWDPTVHQDIATGLDVISPNRAEYRHGEGNSPAHLKSSLVGASLFVPISGGRMALGRWQGIYVAEFDGPRRRRVLVNVLAG